jgi:hypothetical protein
MTRDTILSLCDLTGNFTAPWVEAGYRAILVDPQHGMTHVDGRVTRVAATVLEALPLIMDELPRLAFVAGWPPCTDMAVSGARWFEAKRAADPAFYAKAVAVAVECRTIGELSGAPYLVENPVSTLSAVFGKPSHTFDPWQFTALEPDDNYTKHTCLWTGGGFRMPAAQIMEGLSEPDNRIHTASPGAERANIRSVTPMGFARAVFASNGLGLDVSTVGTRSLEVTS